MLKYLPLLTIFLLAHPGISQEVHLEIISKVNESLSIISVDGRYGLMKSDGNFVLKPVYKKIEYESGSEYVLVLDTARQGYFLYDPGLMRILPYRLVDHLKYAALKKTNSEYILVAEGTSFKNIKLGYMSYDGALKIPFEYEFAMPFIEGKAVVKKRGKFGMINLENEAITPFRYAMISGFRNGYAFVETPEGKYGFINKDGKLVISERYASANHFHLGKAIVSTENGYGVIDEEGNFVIQPQYDYLYESERLWDSSLFVAQKGDQWGVLSRTGEVIVPIEYEEDMGLFVGLIRVTQGGKDGVYDRTGELVIPFEYDKIRILPMRFIAVYKDNKVGIFDNDGRQMIPIEYDEWKRDSCTRFQMMRNSEVVTFDLSN